MGISPEFLIIQSLVLGVVVLIHTVVSEQERGRSPTFCRRRRRCAVALLAVIVSQPDTPFAILFISQDSGYK